MIPKTRQIRNLKPIRNCVTHLVCSLSLLASSVYSQDILTNAAVVEMVKSGLSPDIVIAKIRSSSVNFDTSTSALKVLKEAGVPENIVIEMITEGGKADKASAALARENDKILSGVPEQGKLKELLDKTKVYINTKDLKARDIIEKELKRLKKFTVVDKVETCDFVIDYESWTELVNVSATVIGNTATARENHQLVGLFTVKAFSDSTDSGRMRLIYSARKSRYFVWEDNPAESTTKQFIKDLIKVAALSGSK